MAQMNLRAARLGMEHSRFANPQRPECGGALLHRAGPGPSGPGLSEEQRLWRPSPPPGPLLWRGGASSTTTSCCGGTRGCVGLKTGYTEKAGRTLVSAAEREGHDPDRRHPGRSGRLAGPCCPVRLGLFQLADGDSGPGGGGGSAPLPVGGAAWSPSVQSRRGRDLRWPLRVGEQLELSRTCLWSSSPLRCRRGCGSAPSHLGGSGGRGGWGDSAGVRRRSPGTWRSPEGNPAPAAAGLAGRALNERRRPDMEERLQKLISSCGLASRRTAEAWISQGRVTVNGSRAALGGPGGSGAGPGGGGRRSPSVPGWSVHISC